MSESTRGDDSEVIELQTPPSIGVKRSCSCTCESLLLTLQNQLHRLKALETGFADLAKSGSDSTLGKRKDRSDFASADNDDNRHDYIEYRVGPFILSWLVDFDDYKLLSYMFEDSLERSEVLVQLHHNYLTRHSILTLVPDQPVDREVISAVMEILADDEKKKSEKSPLNWFIPTRYAQMVLSGKLDPVQFVERQKLKTTYMYDLSRCKKIFVPLNDVEVGHWFLLVVHIDRLRAEIWDPLPHQQRKLTRQFMSRLVLHSFDLVLKNEMEADEAIFFLSFSRFAVEEKTDIPVQRPDTVDSGILVIKYMQNANSVLSPDLLYDSHEERSLLARWICKSKCNKVRKTTFENSQNLILKRQTYKHKSKEVAEKEPVSQDGGDIDWGGIRGRYLTRSKAMLQRKL